MRPNMDYLCFQVSVCFPADNLQWGWLWVRFLRVEIFFRSKWSSLDQMQFMFRMVSRSMWCCHRRLYWYVKKNMYALIVLINNLRLNNKSIYTLRSNNKWFILSIYTFLNVFYKWSILGTKMSFLTFWPFSNKNFFDTLQLFLGTWSFSMLN